MCNTDVSYRLLCTGKDNILCSVHTVCLLSLMRMELIMQLALREKSQRDCLLSKKGIQFL